MPLSKVQTGVLRLIAAHRNPDSYVLCHSREERVPFAAEADAKTLEFAGYHVEWIRRLPAGYTAEVSGPPGAMHLEWFVDSDFRFFPVVRDDTFGCVLHPIDLATNKVMAAAGRREVRDIVDVVTLHETILPLGAVIWAAVDIIIAKLRAALDDAEAFVSRMATDMTGLLFLQGGKAVQPDPALLEHYETHRGQLRGHWPASGEITAAMLERYNP